MDRTNILYKNVFIIVFLVFGVITLYTIKTDEVPQFILFLGRFHPLLLHLPIGALVVTFFLEIINRIEKKDRSDTVKHLIGFTSIFSIITCFLGYFLSLEGGYSVDTLNIHFYTGISTAVLTSVLFYVSMRNDKKMNKTFLPLFVVTLILICITGHFGSVLTHGNSFLTEYIGAKPKEKTIQVVDSLKIYEDVVYKIFDGKCIQCHNTSKRKGELSLSTPDFTLKGGNSGSSLVAGNPKKSLLFTRLLLPISNKEHMPPEGKEQLTKDELWLIKHWIESGAEFDGYAKKIAVNDTLKEKLKKYLVFNKVELPIASKEDIESAREAGFRVFKIVPNEAALILKLIKKNPNPEDIKTLEKLEEQIVELDFFNSEMTDDMLNIIKDMKNLRFLRLNNKNITDASIKYLKRLKRLEVLNLYNTSISDEGLSELLETIKPKRIYTWNTQVNDSTVIALNRKYGVDIQNRILKGFVENSQLEMPIVTPTKTLFKDTIHVTAKSRIKDVDVRYTLDGSAPDSTSKRLTKTLIFDKSQTLKVSAFKKGWLASDVLVKDFAKIGQNITSYQLVTKPSKSYGSSGKLFDLSEGSVDFRDGEWTGFFGDDLNVTVDLGAKMKVDNISFSCLEDVNTWILYPTKLSVFASNDKSSGFVKVGDVLITRKGQGGDAEFKKVHLGLQNVEARFFKIIIKNHNKLPDWHVAAGNPAWLFVDEIYFW